MAILPLLNGVAELGRSDGAGAGIQSHFSLGHSWFKATGINREGKFLLSDES